MKTVKMSSIHQVVCINNINESWLCSSAINQYRPRRGLQTRRDTAMPDDTIHQTLREMAASWPSSNVWLSG